MHLKIIKFAAYYKQENKTISPYLKGGKLQKGHIFIFGTDECTQLLPEKHTHTQQAQKKILILIA